MTDTDANRDKYGQIWLVAGYLESEWSDFLFKPSKTSGPSPSNPLTDKAQPNFYKQIGQFVYEVVTAENLEPERYCDAGGSTGRTLYEISNRITSLNELVLVEPSASFCEWARKMLCRSDDLGWVPMVEDWTKPTYDKAADRPKAVTKNVDIFEGVVENLPRPKEHFDLITCLNVADRHSDPVALVKCLYEFLKPGGLLIFSSPMEFEDKFTPDKTKWVVDLNKLFEDTEWNRIREENYLYDFRYYSRKLIRYNSQVLAMRKK
jgi:SAM-dependent methyltransferase